MNPVSTKRSEELFRRACQKIPGGVNSPVRAFGAVGGTPRFIAEAAGCRLIDVDGNRLVDYVGSWGPMILGHAFPPVLEAVREAASRGTSFGAPTEREIELAELICRMVPSVDKVRLVNSGTEATMSALRVARGYTGRSKVVKFDGCYHGHGDSFLVQAGSGVATLGLPSTPGVPPELTEQTLSLPFNDLEAVEEAFDRYGDEIAAVICEPVTGNMGVIVPDRDYLAGLIELAERKGAVVIFDEVMTGFRLSAGGAQELFGLSPHLTTLGKIVGGGLPIGAFGGRKEIMDRVAPEGDVYQAGTLSGNPVAVAAGTAVLKELEERPPYEDLQRVTTDLCSKLRKSAASANISVVVQSCGSMFTVFFSEKEVKNFEDVKACDLERFRLFFNRMLESGIYLAPSQFEACFVSTAHDEEALLRTAESAHKAFQEL